MTPLPYPLVGVRLADGLGGCPFGGRTDSGAVFTGFRNAISAVGGRAPPFTCAVFTAFRNAIRWVWVRGRETRNQRNATHPSSANLAEGCKPGRRVKKVQKVGIPLASLHLLPQPAGLSARGVTVTMR